MNHTCETIHDIATRLGFAGTDKKTAAQVMGKAVKRAMETECDSIREYCERHSLNLGLAYRVCNGMAKWAKPDVIHILTLTDPKVL